jgi:hypothetical protein
MKFRFLAIFAVIVFSFSVSAIAQKVTPAAPKSIKLAKMLPESDVVVTVDVKRLFAEALPQMLLGNPSMLSEINGHADEIRARTGIDLRQFDQVAIGATIKKISEKEVDVVPVVLAQGKYTPASLLSAVKLASNNEYREENIGGKTIYIFTTKGPVEKALPATGNSMIGRLIGRATKGIFANEIAVGPLDAETMVFGPVERVRQAIDGKTPVRPAVLGLPGLQHGGVASFGAKLPVGVSALLGFDNDELGTNINSVRYLSGWMDLSDGRTVLRVTAKTTQAAEAADFLETILSLQDVGKALLSRSKDSDRQVYSRMIENAKFSRVANEITLDLQVPQSDINILIGEKK